MRIREGASSTPDCFCRRIEYFESHDDIRESEVQGSVLRITTQSASRRLCWSPRIGNQYAHERQTAKMKVKGWDEQCLKRKNTTLQGSLTEIALLGRAGVQRKRSVSTMLRIVWKDSMSDGCLNLPSLHKAQQRCYSQCEAVENIIVYTGYSQIHPYCSWDRKSDQQLSSTHRLLRKRNTRMNLCS